MSASDEARAARNRLDALADDLSRRLAAGDPGVAFLPCVTVAVASYPTSPGSFFGVRPLLVTGTEAEGAGVGVAPAGTPFLAANLGTGLPPPGTRVRVWRVPHRFVMAFNG